MFLGTCIAASSVTLASALLAELVIQCVDDDDDDVRSSVDAADNFDYNVWRMFARRMTRVFGGTYPSDALLTFIHPLDPTNLDDEEDKRGGSLKR